MAIYQEGSDSKMLLNCIMGNVGYLMSEDISASAEQIVITFLKNKLLQLSIKDTLYKAFIIKM